MSAYAAPYDHTTKGSRVSIVIAGIGMSEKDSFAAIKRLPSEVTLAISPYAADLNKLLATARAAGHELLLSVPMEPQGYPANDPDDRYSLMTSSSPVENLGRLRRALARFGGYVGVTSALGPLHGERFLGIADQREMVMQELAHRGLLFVDTRPVAAHSDSRFLPYVESRSVDLTLDADVGDQSRVEELLDSLAGIARENGSALGVASAPQRVILERISAWADTLATQGLVLAPVSSLVLRPPPKDAVQ